MKQSLIIVDPWQTVEPHDKVIRPWLQDEVDIYCKFLNHVVNAEIYKGTDVYIDASQQIVNKNLDSSIPMIDMQELHSKNYTKNIFIFIHYIIFFGLTHSSYSSEVTYPKLIASSFKVVPFLWAVLAISAAL